MTDMTLLVAGLALAATALWRPRSPAMYEHGVDLAELLAALDMAEPTGAAEAPNGDALVDALAAVLAREAVRRAGDNPTMRRAGEAYPRHRRP